ncbi:hypothetical protein BDV25DRAFT_154276 [Aspergillus avenaceus]|uniref:Uncharacterized protein n=1 Tax=Aspergillus avenaceus TaxID=36643 RepID=A0A5N6TVP3_ASPAV|nr:hypothetical protein BDV25DRAFT_154276 [Aspergillus avenaceus]
MGHIPHFLLTPFHHATINFDTNQKILFSTIPFIPHKFFFFSLLIVVVFIFHHAREALSDAFLLSIGIVI